MILVNVAIANTFGEEPLRMFVDLKRRIRTCPHFVHQKCCEELCSHKTACPETPPACPECNTAIVDTVLLPNPFKDPDGWFDALDIRHCGRAGGEPLRLTHGNRSQTARERAR